MNADADEEERPLKQVLFEKHKGVDIFVDEEGRFRFKIGKVRKARAYDGLHHTRREVERLLRSEKVKNRERPHLPCIVVVQTGGPKDSQLADDAYVDDEIEIPAYEVMGAIYTGIDGKDGSVRIEREKALLKNVVAVFRESGGQAAAFHFIKARHTAFQAALEMKRTSKESVSYGKTNGVYDIEKLLKKAGLPASRGDALELVEDEIAARLLMTPSPIEIVKAAAKKAVMKDTDSYGRKHELDEVEDTDI